MPEVVSLARKGERKQQRYHLRYGTDVRRLSEHPSRPLLHQGVCEQDGHQTNPQTMAMKCQKLLRTKQEIVREVVAHDAKAESVHSLCIRLICALKMFLSGNYLLHPPPPPTSYAWLLFLFPIVFVAATWFNFNDGFRRVIIFVKKTQTHTHTHETNKQTTHTHQRHKSKSVTFRNFVCHQIQFPCQFFFLCRWKWELWLGTVATRASFVCFYLCSFFHIIHVFCQ